MCLDVSAYLYTQWLNMFYVSTNVYAWLNNVWTCLCEPMVLSIALLHSLGHNDQNEVKHYFFSHVMLMIPALLLTASLLAPFCSFSKDNWNKVWHASFGHVILCEHHMTLMALWMAPFCFIGQDDQNEMQHGFWVMWCH